MARASILAGLVDLVSSNPLVAALLVTETDGYLDHVYGFGLPSDEIEYQPRQAVVIRRVPGGSGIDDLIGIAHTQFITKVYGGTNAEAEALDLEVYNTLKDVYGETHASCRIIGIEFLDGPEDQLEVFTDILRVPCVERSYMAEYHIEE